MTPKTRQSWHTICLWSAQIPSHRVLLAATWMTHSLFSTHLHYGLSHFQNTLHESPLIPSSIFSTLSSRPERVERGPLKIPQCSSSMFILLEFFTIYHPDPSVLAHLQKQIVSSSSSSSSFLVEISCNN